jgi:hypothetical protein
MRHLPRAPGPEVRLELLLLLTLLVVATCRGVALMRKSSSAAQQARQCGPAGQGFSQPRYCAPDVQLPGACQHIGWCQHNSATLLGDMRRSLLAARGGCRRALHMQCTVHRLAGGFAMNEHQACWWIGLVRCRSTHVLGQSTPLGCMVIGHKHWVGALHGVLCSKVPCILLAACCTGLERALHLLARVHAWEPCACYAVVIE